MITVIFEALPQPEHKSDYFDIAGTLRPLLDEIDGFISIERFESITTPGKILSLSFWRDEEAVKAWRTLEEHRAAQSQGRARIFRDYRLRVADVLRDYGMTSRGDVPKDSQARHDA
ncbi:antibiotic biosynthesis monooxygenase [Thalassospira sp. TSL5-1]|uniref:antibiotic biosynthesis monooxygenase family protein n=1 Tax=Thalassospira sp. TSL5-1 TaxID=1544451 RepID=UPI00093ABC15|nr:antibiotic biosynthesis monooxygenase [Thalassospira sp. TSL5-1]OKH87399.1 antibiotic biosynthesis monooxygenase [Thalassospira sp. TSL5-1]